MRRNATKRQRVNSATRNVGDIAKNNDPERATELLLLLDESCIATEDLRKFPVENYDKVMATKRDTAHLNLKKLICLYDLFKWGRIAR
jgi:hypothetical protein